MEPVLQIHHCSKSVGLALSLLDYSQHQLGQNLDFSDVAERSQRRYWFSDRGEPLADFYIRYENLDEDYAWVCSHLGLPMEPLRRLRVGRRDTGKPY